MLVAAFTLAQILGYPFPVCACSRRARDGDRLCPRHARVRTIWFARAPACRRRAGWHHALFSSGGDDGQELTNLAISNDDAHVVYVRGGDHDANWPLPLQPGPASMPPQPEMQVWSVSTSGVAHRSCSATATAGDLARRRPRWFTTDGGRHDRADRRQRCRTSALLRSRSRFGSALVA